MLFSLHTDICKEIVSEAKDDEFDMNTCESVYLSSAWIVTLAMAINMLLKLHFAFAIHSYTKRVKQEIEQEEMMNSHVVIVAPPPAYPTAASMDVKEQSIYVAGQKFIPDEKKQSQQ